MAAIVRTQEEEASSSTCEYTYDVFLSFRGKDTRKNFTDHLYTALAQAGYHTFRDDDEIERGESLKPELEKAIKGSRISIIVFSKDYASSPWCLDELLMILECRRSSRHVVLPVFYDVCPSEIRKQKGRTGEAFERYVELYKAEIDHGRKMELMEKVKGWKLALEKVADLAGMELKSQADGHESRFIQKIINWIRGKLRLTPLFVAPYLIGMHSRAKNINKWLLDDSSKSLLGICGMGGIGKTTLAKFIYDKNYESFDCSCFLSNVREMSEKPNGLVGLQRQLLSSILNKKHEKIYNVDEGIIKIKKTISHKRVLLVLDDVDQVDQLNALRGLQDWFYRGSKIIVTTRYEKLLKPPEVFEVYKAEKLSHDESIKLFSFYAFGQEHPTEGYREHTERVVQLSGGLPLALQVIGSSLCGRTIPQWANEVKKLEAIPHKKILDKLKISYDCLEDDNDKTLFLDIACFFVGNDKDYTVKILDSNDTYADVGIQNLIDRYLLTIDSRNKLMMHQLLRDMGRNIVKQESFEPQRRSRLWHQKEACNVLRNKNGTTTIEGLALDMSMLMKDDNIARKRKYDETLDNASPLTGIRSFFHRFGFLSFLLGQQISPDLGNQSLNLRTDAFEKMEMLRLLKLNYTQLYGRYDNFPKNLIWLCWHGFPLKYMPIELSLENLVALDLSYSKLEEVWPDPKFLGTLKILNLSYSEGLAKTPNFLGVPNLERLILKGCVNLTEICESIEFLEELNLLNLENCKSLWRLPRNLHKLGSLETLIISGCSNLFASGHAINTTHTTNWQGKWWCTSVSLLSHEVPRPIKGPDTLWASLPNSLRSLYLSNCNLSDDSLPYAFSKLSLLQNLDLGFNSFLSLPDCISRLGNLEWLCLQRCDYIRSVIGLPSNLKMLDLGSCGFLKEITFESAPFQLSEIETLNCMDVIELKGIFKSEPIGNVEEGIIKNLGIDIEIMRNLKVAHMRLSNIREDPIQGLYEFGIFSTFLPRGEVPSFFSDKSRGSSISFIVPLLPNLRRIRYLNVCFVYASTDDPYPSVAKINNKTKDLTWIYLPTYFGFPIYLEEYAWLSQWNFGNQLEGGDEVTVSMVGDDSLDVKECGINVVYSTEQQEDQENNGNNRHDNTYFFHNAVVGGDLSGFKLSTGAYFLCRTLFDFYYGSIQTSWLRNLFGDTIDYQEILGRNVLCGLHSKNR